MRRAFFEKRRQLREPVEAGTARLQGCALRIVNWSQNGMLLDGAVGPFTPGQRFSAEVELVAVGSERFLFEAEGRVARLPGPGRLGVTYVCMDSRVAARIARHFNPLPGQAVRFLSDSRIEPRPVEEPLIPPPPPPRSPSPDPTAQQDDTVRLADMVVAAREVAQLKTAFARRFHPDTAPRDETHAIRVELFKEFWDVLDSAERRLRGGR